MKRKVTHVDVLELLKLPPDGSAADAVGAIKKSYADHVETLKRAIAAESRIQELEQRIAGYEGELASAKVDGLIEAGYRSGRLMARRDKNGTRLKDMLEPMLKAIARDSGAQALEQYIASLPQRVPLGVESVTARAPTPEQDLAAVRSASSVYISPAQRRTNEQLGITDEMFAKFAPRADDEGE